MILLGNSWKRLERMHEFNGGIIFYDRSCQVRTYAYAWHLKLCILYMEWRSIPTYQKLSFLWYNYNRTSCPSIPFANLSSILKLMRNPPFKLYKLWGISINRLVGQYVPISWYRQKDCHSLMATNRRDRSNSCSARIEYSVTWLSVTWSPSTDY